MDQKHKLKIPYYHQTMPTSCLAACFLMIGNFLWPEKFSLTNSQESEIQQKIRYWKGKEGELGSFPKLALYALENGLKVSYFLVGPSGKPPEIDEKIWKKYLQNFYPPLEKAKKLSGFTSMTTHCTVGDIISEVGKNHPVICEIKYEDFVTHTRVVRGWKNNLIYTIDPLKGYFPVHWKELEDAMDLGYMKNFMSFSKKE
jgi:hypothetical protein